MQPFTGQIQLRPNGWANVVAKVAKTFGESEIPKLLASFATINQPVNGYEKFDNSFGVARVASVQEFPVLRIHSSGSEFWRIQLHKSAAALPLGIKD